MLIQNEFMFLLGGTEKAFSVCSMYCFYFCSNSKIKIPKLQKYAHYKIIIRLKKFCILNIWYMWPLDLLKLRNIKRVSFLCFLSYTLVIEQDYQ